MRVVRPPNSAKESVAFWGAAFAALARRVRRAPAAARPAAPAAAAPAAPSARARHGGEGRRRHVGGGLSAWHALSWGHEAGGREKRRASQDHCGAAALRRHLADHGHDWAVRKSADRNVECLERKFSAAAQNLRPGHQFQRMPCSFAALRFSPNPSLTKQSNARCSAENTQRRDDLSNRPNARWREKQKKDKDKRNAKARMRESVISGNRIAAATL